MSEVQVGTFGRPAAIAVESVGRRLIEAGLGCDGSLLTPGRPIWTPAHLDELQAGYVDKPDTSADGFFPKLSRQLSGASPEVIQLFAELLIVNVLPILNVGGELKVRQVRNVLELSSGSPPLPDDVEAALLGGGVFHGGQAFTTYRWAQIAFLIQFARHFKSLPEQRRAAALSEPVVFRDEVTAVPTGQGAQRQSLLYLAFPQFFLPVVTSDHRTAIRDGLAGRFLAEPSADIDEDLARIYAAVCTAEGGPVDLYASPWVELWQKSAPPKPGPSDKVRHAWVVRGASIRGQDMVKFWRVKHSVSLAASLLRPVDTGVTKEELQAVVSEDYRSSGYAARQEKFDEFYTFLARMHTGDLVVTHTAGELHFGTITGPATFVTSSDGRSNLRRQVQWLEHTCPWSELPEDLAARLGAQGDVIDLSQYRDDLQALAERRHRGAQGVLVHLPDATAALATRLYVTRDWLQDCVELLRDRRQLIFYGPPGTGKTYLAQALARHLTDEANVKLVQFHPAYSYEDFFEGFRPHSHNPEGALSGFALKAGPLRRMVDKAVENPSAAYVLIIDEINRGNLPKIFGELYFLLEYRDQAIDLMYSSDSAEPFSLPKNIFVIGTMNTADRSIALVDAALRRRFAFLPLHPGEEPTRGVLRRWLADRQYGTALADLHDALNARISDHDFRIGPSYFMREKLATDPTGRSLDLMWRTDILPLLEEHHFGDPGIDVADRYGLAALRTSLAARLGVEASPPESRAGHVADTDPH